MNCEKAKPRIPLLVENDLDAADMQQVTEHLETCHLCRHLVAEFQASQSSLRAATLPEFDEAVLAQVRMAVQDEIARTATRPPMVEWLPLLWNWKVAFVATAGLWLVSGIVLSRRGGGEQQRVHVAQVNPAVNSASPTSTPLRKQALPNSPGAMLAIQPRREQQGFQPRMGRKKIAQGEVSVSERNPGSIATNYLSPERAIEIGNLTASLAPSGADDSSANVSSDAGLILPPAQIVNLETKPPPPEPEMLRMEIHTADPNIKIIWLTPKEPTRTNAAPIIEATK